MTKDEARKVIAIMETADHGCSYCVGDLLDKFAKEFPEHLDVMPAWYKPGEDNRY